MAFLPKTLNIFCILVLFQLLTSSAEAETHKKYLSRENPQQILRLPSNKRNNGVNETYQVLLDEDLKNEENEGWKFSITLEGSFKCGYNNNQSIKLDYNKGKDSKSETWACTNSQSITRHMGDLVYNVSKTPIDNLRELNITFTSDFEVKSQQVVLVAAIYFDSPKSSCPSEYFNCDINHINCETSLPYKSRSLLISSSKNKNTESRCIPLALMCDDHPSCGKTLNLDEANEVCHTEYYCQGVMDWTFIVTRCLVAIIFVLIPTIVVMLLFHRRQLALHRARIHREAELARRRINQAVSVIDMSERYANDHPPTYDDLYETKEPPPCFCQALGLSGHPNHTPTTTTPDDRLSSEGLEASSVRVNPSFECACKSS